MGNFSNSIKIINDILTDLIDADNKINYLESENIEMQTRINNLECLSNLNANSIENLSTKIEDIITILELEQDTRSQIINRLKN